MASWADGLLTVGADPTELGEIRTAYCDAGGRGSTALQVHFVLRDTDEAAMAVVRDQWGHGVVTPPRTWEIATPEEFERLAERGDDKLLRQEVVVATDLDDLVARITAAATGFDRVYLHEISQDQSWFLRELAPDLLHRLRSALVVTR